MTTPTKINLWTGQKYYPELFESGSRFCGCCGSRFYKDVYPKAPRIRNGGGIALFPKHVYTPGRSAGSKHNVHHVDTKDGPITIIVKEVW